MPSTPLCNVPAVDDDVEFPSRAHDAATEGDGGDDDGDGGPIWEPVAMTPEWVAEADALLRQQGDDAVKSKQLWGGFGRSNNEFHTGISRAQVGGEARAGRHRSTSWWGRLRQQALVRLSRSV